MDNLATFQWQQLARRQKIYMIAAAVLVVLVIGGFVIDDLRASLELRAAKKETLEAKRDKDEALAQAAKIVSTIKIREEELAKVEAKKDAKKQEVDQAKRDVDRARAEYDRAVVARDPIIPSTDDLCRRLADAGHPCS